MKIFWPLLLTIISVGQFLAVYDAVAGDTYVHGDLGIGVFSSSGNLITENITKIATGKTVLFVAVGDIVLKDGFEASLGSTFRARTGNFGQLNNDTDNDGDGLFDWWELLYFDDTSPGRNDDTDGDGISNYREAQMSLDPTSGTAQANGNFYKYDAFGRMTEMRRGLLLRK